MFRVGIIGCGLIGKKRARVIAEDPFARLCCAADMNAFSAAGLIKEYGEGKGIAYQDWRNMLDKETLDAVVVATPNKFLKKITLWAAQRNIHVLCEKPLGRNAWEAERMVEVTRENRVILKTGFNHRYHPAISKAHEMAEDGAIGEIYFARCIYGHGGRPGYEKEWRARKDESGGGELLDQGVHVVDLFRWFMGEFEEAYGYIPTYYWNMEVEDNAFALFKTSEGKVATMHTSWTQWKNRFTFEIFGEPAYLIVEGLGGSYGTEKVTLGKRPINPPCPPLEKGRKFDLGKPQYLGGAPEEETIIFDGSDISWDLEWKEFVQAIQELREPLGSGQDGLEANRMIEAVYRSARENRPVKIKDMQ